MKIRYCFLLSIILGIAIQYVQSFCVYNNSNRKKVWFTQRQYHTTATQFSRFKTGEMLPFGHQCCPYTTTDCSKSGEKDSTLLMEIVLEKYPLQTITFPAGGWVELNDSREEPYYTIDVFDSNGSPYNYKVFDADTVNELEKSR